MHNKRLTFLYLSIGLLLGGLVVGCGDDAADPADATVDPGAIDAPSDTRSDTGSDTATDSTPDSPADTSVDTIADTATDPGPPPSPCPAEAPANEAACEMADLICDYGMRSCLTRATCTDGQWDVPPVRCSPPPEGGCPDTREDASGNPCPGSEGARCDFDEGLVCECTSCPNPYPLCMVVDPPVWACEAPNPDEACPVAQPLLGTGCAMDAQSCDYGCEGGERRVCEGGVWTPASQPGGCPRSTRRAKRDIEYLQDSEVNELAEQVRRTQLATYEYTDPAMAGRRRLGFIIEDQPQSYSVDPERSQVDLYGYMSLLVAAMQEQDRRIQELEQQLEATR